MANVSATCLSYKSSLNLPTSTISSQSSYRNSSLRTVSFVGWTRSRGSYFPSLRTSGFRISCAAAQDETVQKVCDVVRKQLALPPESVVTPNTKFSELGADSLDTVEIVMSLEEEFGISVEQENSENITTVQDAAELIEKLVQTKASS